MFNIKEIYTNLGTYNLRARISVGIIFLAPWLLELYLLIPEINSISSTLIVGIITYGLCNIIIVYCRLPGVKAMKKCFPNLLPALIPLQNTDITISFRSICKILKYFQATQK